MREPTLNPLRALVPLACLLTWIGCRKVSIEPRTSLLGTRCSRVEVTQGPPAEYEFMLLIPNKDGSLHWRASSSEPLAFKVEPGKPFTQISWRASRARVESAKQFEISLFLESAGPSPIPVTVRTYPDSHLGLVLGAIPIHF